MTRCTVIITMLLAASAAPATAQFVVVDPGNFAQAVLIAERTLREYETLVAQYETLLRMSRGLPNMARYRIAPTTHVDHAVERWEYGRAWLQGLNAGDPTGAAYAATTRQLESPRYVLQRLSPAAQRAVEQAYATVEIADSASQRGGHQIALIRGYARRVQDAIEALEGDVVSADPRAHEMTAVLDKVAAGSLIARRQDMAANQLLSHALEQLLARSKRVRDTEAVTMNMRLGGLRSGRTAGASVVRGAANDLRTWSQP